MVNLVPTVAAGGKNNRGYNIKRDMKKLLTLSTVLLALAVMTACSKKNDERIVGKWEVKTYYYWNHDLTDESLSEEATITLPDTTYAGYDWVEFREGGTTRWHMSDRWVREGLHTDPYRDFEWRISGDSLLVSSNWVADNISRYAIKELDSKTLVIEQYTNNGHEEYSHHHREQIHRYTFKRVK